eukprot:1086705-Rhodomonas_salina.3
MVDPASTLKCSALPRAIGSCAHASTTTLRITLHGGAQGSVMTFPVRVTSPTRAKMRPFTTAPAPRVTEE